MNRIDLNCDLGEGAGHDAELMPLITSANIACGGHAGDEATMRATVELAQKHGVAIGAHPGFADKENFGRRELALPPAEIFALAKAQVLALRALAPLKHVKPHGGLYNLAARDATVAGAIAVAVRTVDPKLILFGLAGSELIKAGRERGLRVAEEVFADRTYQPDGSLTPRSSPNALITDEDAAVAQVLRLIREGKVRATDGTDIFLKADTICLHGDGPNAVAFARLLTSELKKTKISKKAFGVESMVFEVWRSNDSGTIIEAGDAESRAMNMQEPGSRLVRRTTTNSWETLKPQIDEEMHAVKPDDLNIPASEFQISVYPNGVKVGDIFEITKQYWMTKQPWHSLPDDFRVPSKKIGTRFAIVEGDVQDPALVVMRCLSDEWEQFHLMRIDAPEWAYYKKV